MKEKSVSFLTGCKHVTSGISWSVQYKPNSSWFLSLSVGLYWWPMTHSDLKVGDNNWIQSTIYIYMYVVPGYSPLKYYILYARIAMMNLQIKNNSSTFSRGFLSFLRNVQEHSSQRLNDEKVSHGIDTCKFGKKLKRRKENQLLSTIPLMEWTWERSGR